MEHDYSNSINLIAEKNTKKESFIFGIILFAAFACLIFLHISKDGANNSQPATIVRQTKVPMATNAAQAIQVKKVETFPGKLVLTDKQPEAKQRLTFEMTEFSKGATYSIDTGDGHKKPFVDAKVNHTYQKSGKFYVRLYAEFDNQVIEVSSQTFSVAPALETVMVPGVDY